MIGYVPTGLAAVAVVLSDPVNAVAALSPFTNPLAEYVRAGIPAPYTLVWLLAVTLSAAGVTTSAPF